MFSSSGASHGCAVGCPYVLRSNESDSWSVFCAWRIVNGSKDRRAVTANSLDDCHISQAIGSDWTRSVLWIFYAEIERIPFDWDTAPKWMSTAPYITYRPMRPRSQIKTKEFDEVCHVRASLYSFSFFFFSFTLTVYGPISFEHRYQMRCCFTRLSSSCFAFDIQIVEFNLSQNKKPWWTNEFEWEWKWRPGNDSERCAVADVVIAQRSSATGKTVSISFLFSFFYLLHC